MRLVVTGWSMAPLLQPGDTLVIVPPEPRPEPGMVVTVRQAGTLLSHRVLRQNAAGLLLRGDACRQPDRLVAWHDLVGIGVARERPGRAMLTLRQGLLAVLGRWTVLGSPSVSGLRALGSRIGWVIGLWLVARGSKV